MLFTLPYDITEYVFSRFAPSLPPKDLAALALASRAINGIITPILYHRVSFTLRVTGSNEAPTSSTDCTTTPTNPQWFGGEVSLMNGEPCSTSEPKVDGLENERLKWAFVRAQAAFFRTLAARSDLAAMVLDFEWEIPSESTERQFIALILTHFPLLTHATRVHLIMHKAFEAILKPDSAATHGLAEIEATKPISTMDMDGTPTAEGHDAKPTRRLFPALASLRLSHHAAFLTLIKTLLLAPPCAPSSAHSPISPQLHTLHLDSSVLDPGFVTSAHWLSTLPFPSLTSFTMTFPIPDYEGTAIGFSVKVANMLAAFSPTLEKLTIGLRAQRRKTEWLMLEGGLEGIYEAPMIERSLIERFVELFTPRRDEAGAMGAKPFPNLRALTFVGVRRSADQLWEPLRALMPSLHLDYRSLVVEE